MDDQEVNERILCIDNHVMALVTIMESMRCAGFNLTKCTFRGEIDSAIELFKKNTSSIRVFMVDSQVLVDYAAKQKKDLSCFVRMVSLMARQNANCDIIFVMTSFLSYQEVAKTFRESLFNELIEQPLTVIKI
jgi:hypothetical protein